MRHIVITVLAAAGLATLTAPPAQAVGTRHPFCLQGDEFPGLSHCTFDSYEQCMATASGRFLTCIANPLFRGPGRQPLCVPHPQSPPAASFSRAGLLSALLESSESSIVRA